MEFTYVKFEVLIPEEYIHKLRDELNDAGLLNVGHYDHVLSYVHVKGYWRPLQSSTPYRGTKGKVSFGEECRVEFTCSADRVEVAKRIIKNIHPYEEPVIHVLPQFTI
ncbi:cytochrome c biogenesis protein [Geomicrobium sp. JCM 19039]|uniref:cytochrome c biogenesis protein n=1 Tax=Geomicrobium sp. JCM 19039 TaxID=1460636 RepID=UPI00045F226C|nr:cytochrome c biogenesis protein [Geomicrobium sp. JCM 19039]GAK10479.1 YqfO protein NIF3/CutA domain [Geomicrobium sp. JCM 19039]